MRVVQSLRPCWHSGSHTQARQPKTPNPEPNGKSGPKRPWEPALALLDWYSHSQSRRPYLTQLCLTPLIYCIGDLSAQMIGDDDFDPRRSFRSIVIGLVIAIPSREWFLFLGRRFNYSYFPSLSLCTKVAANQLFYTPLFNVYFFAFHGILSGEGVPGAIERVKNTVPTSIPRSFLYWPLVTAFNFTYVQPQSRSVATSIFAVFWQSYLSWLNSSAEKGTEKRICKPISSDASSMEDLDRRLLMFDDN
ncbi:hypothetical protein BDV27DRAFT_165419 [Aspergillus caelatus]|uniref:Uncharacterized protein n=1 Tax=Aspergillus caelatus TaxID=61420 RepID=A0A5N7A1X5_9EURO|nr:uncharacterized protein BDV27DRAFT_165419 [Aspergillus caelatus]KAE8363543.1 hypothetical protein BDV27DRAFT_165419 [Aspergillus caelatus]